MRTTSAVYCSLRHLNSTHETRIIPNILVNSNSMFRNVVEYSVCKQYIDSIRIQDRLIVKSYSGQAGNINISTYCVTLLVDYTCVQLTVSLACLKSFITVDSVSGLMHKFLRAV